MYCIHVHVVHACPSALAAHERGWLRWFKREWVTLSWWLGRHPSQKQQAQQKEVEVPAGNSCPCDKPGSEGPAAGISDKPDHTVADGGDGHKKVS